MVRRTQAVLCVAAVVGAVLAGCSTLRSRTADISKATAVLESLRTEFAPDSHLAIYKAGVVPAGSHLVLTGDVQSVAARLRTLQKLHDSGIRVVDNLRVLPQEDLGDRTWAIARLSLCNGREGTEHKAELGTQLLMGEVGCVWKRTNEWGINWVFMQSEDGYLAWQSEGNVVRCTEAEAQAWRRSPLVIVTAFETAVLSQPEKGSEALSDAVLLNKLKRLGQEGDWINVELPDGRKGFVPAQDVQDLATWKQTRQPTPEHIEKTARTLLGRPYSWGANSPRGLDCSGFTKIVFASNGIDLMRNAGHQAKQGKEVSIENGLGLLRKGDLLFFGRRASDKGPEKVTHVGIYLGNSQFIHSADDVHISSLDPTALDRDERHIKGLLKARRVLP